MIRSTQLSNQVDHQDRNQVQIKTSSLTISAVRKNRQLSQDNKQVIFTKNSDAPFFPSADGFSPNIRNPKPNRNSPKFNNPALGESR